MTLRGTSPGRIFRIDLTSPILLYASAPPWRPNKGRQPAGHLTCVRRGTYLEVVLGYSSTGTSGTWPPSPESEPKGGKRRKGNYNGKKRAENEKRFTRVPQVHESPCLPKTVNPKGGEEKITRGTSKGVTPYSLKEKSVKGVRAHACTYKDTRIFCEREFLCDNGGEFDNKDVHEILHSNGITQRLTAPYTPDQNGASEREMRTTIEMDRTLKYSNPETGKSSIANTSPYELWLKKKPRLKHLRIIGSPCYAHVPAQKEGKWTRRPSKGTLWDMMEMNDDRIWLKKNTE
ncbi:retrovirus-related Pol polyprotein from transposon TNT 1-94 [Trichonephila clavipes]|nr:retrovirus-related Pol polyprotein from transposon TNT 1-94 [Trichonephila clavipes]